MVAMIRREVNRRQVQGIPTDSYEAALVAYAMGIGDEADRPEPAASTGERSAESSTGGDAVDDPSPSAPVADGLRDSALRVAFTGAFLTGHPLAVRIDNYDALQRQLGDRLTAPHWRTDGLQGMGGTYKSAGGGGFTETLPLVVARREGADLLPWLSSALEGPSQALRNSRPGSAIILDATPRRLIIDLYDLGVAVMTAWFDVVAATGARLDQTADAVKQLVWLESDGEGRSPLADTLQRIASAIAKQYGEAVVAAAPQELQTSWLWRSTQRQSHTSGVRPVSDERGRLLWLHPVHVLRTPDPPWKAARELAPAFRTTVRIDDGVLASGIGSSAVVAPPESSAAATAVRLTELHWAYYALYMEIDRGLLRVLNLERWSQNASLKELEADADDVVADYLRVMEARARLDTHLIGLGGDELAIWETIAKVQRFDTIVASVDRKLDVLDKLAQRRVAQATAARARRTSNFLGAITSLGLITIAIAVVGAVLGSLSGEGAVPLRIAIIATVAAFAIVAYWRHFSENAGLPKRLVPWIQKK
jgi:hypothetical protein